MILPRVEPCHCRPAPRECDAQSPAPPYGVMLASDTSRRQCCAKASTRSDLRRCDNVSTPITIGPVIAGQANPRDASSGERELTTRGNVGERVAVAICDHCRCSQPDWWRRTWWCRLPEPGAEDLVGENQIRAPQEHDQSQAGTHHVHDILGGLFRSINGSQRDACRSGARPLGRTTAARPFRSDSGASMI
jgi:hypothetical protein